MGKKQIMLSGTLLLLSAGAAFAHSSVASPIVSVATEKCLDVANASRIAGEAVNQFSCHGGSNQLWAALPVGSSPSDVTFVNERSTLCLEVVVGGADDGKLRQAVCNGQSPQIFRMEPFNDRFGGVRLAPRHSPQQCLDVPGGSTSDGLRIQRFSCHQGINQRWVHAAPGPYRRPVMASKMGRVEVDLADTITYTISLSGYSAGAAPVLHLWGYNADVAFNSGPTAAPRSELTYTVPPGRRGRYTVFAHARAGTSAGSGTLTVRSSNGATQTYTMPFGGTVVDVPGSANASDFRYETALIPGGTTDTFVLALNSAGAMLAFDDHSGVGYASRISGVASVSRIVVGVVGLTAAGPTALYANDFTTDTDKDGLGARLENEIGTCNRREDHPRCAYVADLRDSDRDGLPDNEELFGVETSPPLLLSYWGASPVHKDVFLEVDYTDAFNSMPMTANEAVAIRDYFTPGRLVDVRNLDGRGGIDVHLDIGYISGDPSTVALFGNWGGISRIPAQHPDKRSFLDSSRRGRFFHGVIDTGGQSGGDHFFGAALEESEVPRRRVRTFVHEFGHALNLEHEGGTGNVRLGMNCSVVYPSIMSYADSAWGDVGFADGRRLLGVSLNPARLCEADGLNGWNADHLKQWGLEPRGNGVDWNRDGSVQSCARPVRGRVNWFGPQGCDTFVQGYSAGTGVVVGSSPSLARLGDFLYLFFVDYANKLRYKVTRQGTAFAGTNGCPLGQPGNPPNSNNFAGRCSDWTGSFGTPETGDVWAVRAYSAGSRMIVAYTDPNSTEIHVLTALSAGTDGVLANWSSRTAIPGARSITPPSMALIYTAGSQRRVAAVWPDFITRQLEIAYINLASGTGFVRQSLPRNDSLQPIATSGGPVTLAYWGRGDLTSSLVQNQTWLALGDAGNGLRIYSYDPAMDLWRDRTKVAFASPPETVTQQIGFAFHPLLDASGVPLDSLKGEFMIVHAKASTDPEVEARVWISNVVDTSRPPDTTLTFPTVLNGRFGNPSFVASSGPRAGFDLFSDPGFPFLRGAAVGPTRSIYFFAHADGSFDFPFQSSSDFQVMERGICFRVRGRDASYCGAANIFGF